MTPRLLDGTTSPPPTQPRHLPRWPRLWQAWALRRSEVDTADSPDAAVESVLYLSHLRHGVCELDQLRRRIAARGDHVDRARPVLDHVDDFRGRDPTPVHRIRDLVEDDQPVVSGLDLFLAHRPGVPSDSLRAVHVLAVPREAVPDRQPLDAEADRGFLLTHLPLARLDELDHAYLPAPCRRAHGSAERSGRFPLSVPGIHHDDRGRLLGGERRTFGGNFLRLHLEHEMLSPYASCLRPKPSILRMNSRITAPTNATTIAVMIGCPLMAKLILKTWARMPPMNAPSTPAMRSPSRPRPCPSATRLASAPATRPTRIQIRIVSTSRRMSITSPTPFYKRRTRADDHAALAASSCSTAPRTRLNAGKGWITSASVRRGVPALSASTSSPTISPARGVTSVAPTSTPRSRSPTSFNIPSWKSWM